MLNYPAQGEAERSSLHSWHIYSLCKEAAYLTFPNITLWSQPCPRSPLPIPGPSNQAMELIQAESPGYTQRLQCPGLILGAHLPPHLTLTTPPRVGYSHHPCSVLYTRNLRQRGAKWLADNHMGIGPGLSDEALPPLIGNSGCTLLLRQQCSLNKACSQPSPGKEGWVVHSRSLLMCPPVKDSAGPQAHTDPGHPSKAPGSIAPLNGGPCDSDWLPFMALNTAPTPQ